MPDKGGSYTDGVKDPWHSNEYYNNGVRWPLTVILFRVSSKSSRTVRVLLFKVILHLLVFRLYIRAINIKKIFMFFFFFFPLLFVYKGGPWAGNDDWGEYFVQYM